MVEVEGRKIQLSNLEKVLYPETGFTKGEVIAEMAKASRAGRVLIDWSQNSDFKTTVSVYSLRAKRAAPYVSMPVPWEILRRARSRKDLQSLDFKAPEALERVEKTGDLFAPLLQLKQRLPTNFTKRLQTA